MTSFVVKTFNWYSRAFCFNCTNNKLFSKRQKNTCQQFKKDIELPLRKELESGDRNMAKKNTKIKKVILECTEARKNGQTPSRYMTTKNTQKHPERLEKMKYNPFIRKHTLHKEIK